MTKAFVSPLTTSVLVIHLAYLKRFPLDVLKIDKSFIDEIPHNKDDWKLPRALVAMRHIYLRFQSAGRRRGDTGTVGFLARAKCDLYQGYLKSNPPTADDFVALIQANDSFKKSKWETAGKIKC